MQTDQPFGPTEALILAGGKGTRLKSLIPDRPKPLAPVAGRPFAEWLVLMLRRQGLRRIVFSTGYKGEMFRDCFQDGARCGVDIAYSHEMAPLGTGGAVRQALDTLQTDRFLVLNGDSWCRANLHELAVRHQRRKAAATILLAAVDDCHRFGAVSIDASQAVTCFAEKCAAATSGLINAGVYLFERRVVEPLPLGRNISLERDVLPQLVGRGLFAFTSAGPFLDIGIPETFQAADAFMQQELAEGHIVPEDQHTGSDRRRQHP